MIEKYNHEGNVSMLQSVSMDKVSGIDTVIANANQEPIILTQAPPINEIKQVDLLPSTEITVVPKKENSNVIITKIESVSDKKKTYAIIGLTSLVVILVLVLIFK